MKRALLAIPFAALRSLAIPRIVQPRMAPRTDPFTSNQSPADEQVRIFAGIIVSKEGGTFFLQDDTNKVLYALDNQALATKFAGKKVLVTGTLDKTGIIRGKNIEEQKA